MTHVVLTIALSQLAAAPVEDRYEEHTYVYTGGEYKEASFKWRLLKPAKIETGKKYPVVLFLHGAGERGTDNKKQLQYFPDWISTDEMRAKFPCFVIAPQCRNGKQWVNVPWGAKKSTPQGEISEQLAAAVGILQEVLAKQPVDRKRVYLTGLSMGGYGTWDLALRHPDWFAAVAPVCGGGDERLAERLKDVPLWAWHGDKDGAVPVERTQQMIAAIKAAGGSPKFTELPGVGHNSWNQAYHGPDNLIPWMFQQVNTRAK